MRCLRAVVTVKVDGLAGLPGRLLVGRDIGVELLLLLGNLVRVVVAALGGLNLQGQHLELQLEHLVLDLADLQGLAGVAVLAGLLDGVVEAAVVRLGRLGRLARRLEDVEVV